MLDSIPCTPKNRKFARQAETNCIKADPMIVCRPDSYSPAIGVYAGTGTSHSWLWFVEILERMFFRNITFLTEDAIRRGDLTNLDVFAMSGGDTITIAEKMGRDGAAALESFIRSGGLYLGSCAGAYLPLKSSKRYLDRFNFVDVKIANLSKTAPNSLLPGKKSATEYGCDFVYHPVREDVFLRCTGTQPFTGNELFRAPLYGGPSMLYSENSEVLAYYERFTEKTLFLVEESLAEKTLLGRVAAVRSQMGKGKLYLFGPHFEHPLFLQANNYIAKTIFWEKPNGTNSTLSILDLFIEGTQKEKFVRDLKRQVSNSRIVSVGLEGSPLEWTIGCKIYRPEKIRVFLDAIWKRIKIMETFHKICISSVSIEETVQLATRVTHILRQIKVNLDNQLDTSDLAENLFDSLRRLTIGFLQAYFPSFNLNLEYDSCVVRR